MEKIVRMGVLHHNVLLGVLNRPINEFVAGHTWFRSSSSIMTT